MGNWLLLFAALLEVAGAFLMASGWLSATLFRERLLILLSALVRGDDAKGAAIVDGINDVNKLSILQGLALIGAGFILQAGVLLWRLLSPYFTQAGG